MDSGRAHKNFSSPAKINITLFKQTVDGEKYALKLKLLQMTWT